MTEERHRESAEAEAELQEAIQETEPAADEMERRSEQLEEEIHETEDEWERKRQDGSVPGAQPDLEDVETHREEMGKAPGDDS